jgi:hypothetical protein
VFSHVKITAYSITDERRLSLYRLHEAETKTTIILSLRKGPVNYEQHGKFNETSRAAGGFRPPQADRLHHLPGKDIFQPGGEGNNGR